MAKDHLEEQIKQAWLEWKANPTKENSQKVIDAAKPLLDRIISGYFGPGYVNDKLLRGRAELHLIKSLQNYDMSKGSIKNFIWINMQRLQRYLGKQQSTLRLSERNISLLTEMDKAEKELEEKLGRPPTTEELADRLKQSPEKIERLRAYKSIGYESSFEAGVDESGGWLPAVKKQDPTFTRELLNVIYDTIQDPREKLIFEYAYGLKGREKLSGVDIANKLGVSQATVSKTIKKIENEYHKLLDFWQRLQSTDIDKEGILS